MRRSRTLRCARSRRRRAALPTRPSGRHLLSSRRRCPAARARGRRAAARPGASRRVGVHRVLGSAGRPPTGCRCDPCVTGAAVDHGHSGPGASRHRQSVTASRAAPVDPVTNALINRVVVGTNRHPVVRGLVVGRASVVGDRAYGSTSRKKGGFRTSFIVTTTGCRKSPCTADPEEFTSEKINSSGSR
jgi:hypothetical protein